LLEGSCFRLRRTELPIYLESRKIKKKMPVHQMKSLSLFHPLKQPYFATKDCFHEL